MPRFTLFALVLAFASSTACSGNARPVNRPAPDAGHPDAGHDAGNPCGNGMIDGTEECDTFDLNGQTCDDFGFSGGTLSCSSDCTLDKSHCVAPTCGDNLIDPGEQCDGTEHGGQSCGSLGYIGGGTLQCKPDCTFDTSECSSCGDGMVQAGEECDGTDLNGATCASRGYSAGTLACNTLCGFDESGCTMASCGNGVRDSSEDCDGSDLGGHNCIDQGFYGGTLACSDGCTFDTSGCTDCGDGTIEGSEQCDGSAFGSATCVSEGFTTGTLACNADCTIDTSGCTTSMCGNGTVESGEGCDDGNAVDGDGCSMGCTVETGWTCTGSPSSCTPNCGDGAILGGEDCDGSNLGGQSCTDMGFTGGTLACSGTCTFDTSGCTTTTCGNGVVDPGEECDDGNTVPFDGCDSGCQVEPTFYLPVRLRGGPGSNEGMLEVHYAGAWRDVCDDTYTAAAQQAMADVVCHELGYTGTGNQFLTAYGAGSGTPVMDNVNCTGTETSLAQCPFAGWNVGHCGPTETVGIRCMAGDGDIRLVDGPSGMEGRLQNLPLGRLGRGVRRLLRRQLPELLRLQHDDRVPTARLRRRHVPHDL